MENICLFSKEDNLCNPSIVEYNGNIVGLVKQWDFDSNPYFEGSTYFFDIDKYNYELNELREIKCIRGLRDYTLFKSNNGLFALVYHKDKVFLVCIEKDNDCKCELITDEIVNDNGFTYKNFSPIQENYILDFIYSISPFKALRIKGNKFEELPIKYKGKMSKSLHGGTRFIPFNDKELISVYHTYEGNLNRFYRVYLVTISKDYPYKPMRISSKSILDGNMVEDNIKPNKKCKWLSQKAKVVFERGIVKVNKKYIISYGVQDKESRLLVATYNELNSLLDKKIDIKEKTK